MNHISSGRSHSTIQTQTPMRQETGALAANAWLLCEKVREQQELSATRTQPVCIYIYHYGHYRHNEPVSVLTRVYRSLTRVTPRGSYSTGILL